MSARTKARKRALDVLFESDLRGVDAVETLATRLARADPPVGEYTVELVQGVAAHRARIDELISGHSIGWTIERMPAVDRNLLRLAIYELLWCDETPDAVVVNEAVGLAQELSTDESASFVNGVLGKLLEEKPTLSA